jgi:hypothetical protein
VHFYASLGHGLGSRLRGIASEPPNAVGLRGFLEPVDNAAALDSSDANDGNKRRGGILGDRHVLESVRIVSGRVGVVATTFSSKYLYSEDYHVDII